MDPRIAKLRRLAAESPYEGEREAARERLRQIEAKAVLREIERAAQAKVDREQLRKEVRVPWPWEIALKGQARE